MSDKQCPPDAELLSFADADLPPEQLRRVERHLELCSACAKRSMAISALIEDIAAPVLQPHFDVAEHTANVMQRLDAPVAVRPSSARAVWGATFVALAAAAAVLLVFLRGPEPEAVHGQLAARGGASVPGTLSRDIGVQLYALDAAGSGPRPLAAGTHIRTGTTLTAGLRNLASQRAYLLLFGIDSRHVVHWLAPQFTVPGSDPEAATIAALPTERLLETSVVFDDLAPGPLLVVALITREPTQVSEIESLTVEQLSGGGLTRRFPHAEIRQTVLDVVP